MCVFDEYLYFFSKISKNYSFFKLCIIVVIIIIIITFYWNYIGIITFYWNFIGIIIYGIRRIRKYFEERKDRRSLKFNYISWVENNPLVQLSSFLIPHSRPPDIGHQNPKHRFILMLDDVQISISFRYIFDSRIT